MNSALAIPLENVKAVVKGLREHQGPLLLESAKRHVSEELKDQPKSARDSLLRLTFFVPELQKHDPDFIPALIARWEESPPSTAQKLEPDEKLKLIKLIDLLSTSIGSIEDGKNVERVARMTGMDLESIELVCDFRPVFTKDGAEEIQAIIPITILKVVCEQESGLSQSVEAHISMSQLDDLEKKLVRAKAKLRTMANFAENNSLPYAELNGSND